MRKLTEAQAAEIGARARLHPAIVMALQQDFEGYLSDPEDMSDNAPWLTLAHSICFDAGIPPGHIADRLAKLRDILDDYRWRPAGKAVIEILRRAMDQAEVTGLQRAYLVCCFTNEWNSAWPAKEEDGPVVGNLCIPKELP